MPFYCLFISFIFTGAPATRLFAAEQRRHFQGQGGGAPNRQRGQAASEAGGRAGTGARRLISHRRRTKTSKNTTKVCADSVCCTDWGHLGTISNMHEIDLHITMSPYHPSPFTQSFWSLRGKCLQITYCKCEVFDFGPTCSSLTWTY